MIQEDKFDRYTVYRDEDNYNFVYIQINEDGFDNFYDSFVNYILDFDKIKSYTQVNIPIEKELELQDYNNIYTSLLNFIDYERILDCEAVDEHLMNILKEEYIDDNNADLRTDKWGRIGEYIFNILLDSYFEFDCIVRKFSMNTSHNMSVYGIDTLHYSHKNSTFYFGESKMVSSLDNGINLIKESLKNYESRISEEYLGVIKNKNFTTNQEFNELYREIINKCFTFQELIRILDIKNIGVPIFISHATNATTEEIFEKLKKIDRKNLFNINTIYYVISHPIFDKEKLRKAFINAVNIKIKECEEFIRRI